MITRFYFLLWLLWALPGAATELPGMPVFIDDMVAKHQFKRDEVTQVLHRAQYRQLVVDAISKPATIKPWPEYRSAFINAGRINGGVKFWARNAAVLEQAEKQYGVPQEIIVAVIGVETLYGRNSGKFRILDALTTLAFGYPPRAEFFRSELENYLLLAREQQWDIFEIHGSYAGAMGFPQFMPSSYLRHGVDYNNDGAINLLTDPIDAIGSVANYLKKYGWKTGEPVAVRVIVNEQACVGSINEPRNVSDWAEVGVSQVTRTTNDLPAMLLDFTVLQGKEFWLAFDNFQVIRLYNNSNFYAMSVYQLAEAIRSARTVSGVNSRIKELVHRHRGLPQYRKQALVAEYLARKKTQKPL